MAQMAQTEEFMFQIVAYRPTVYRTGVYTMKPHNPEMVTVRCAILYLKATVIFGDKWSP